MGLFEDGSPGELFVRMAKEGSVISGLMDSFATAVSIMLQYGVPLKVMVNKFSHTRFEPSGFTNNPDIPHAKSVMDYIFRWLATKFEKLIMPEGHDDEENGKGDFPAMTVGEAEQIAPLSEQVEAEARGVLQDEHGNGNGNGYTGERSMRESEKAVFRLQSDAPPCAECGSVMVRNGSCYRCINCGSTSGCS